MDKKFKLRFPLLPGLQYELETSFITILVVGIIAGLMFGSLALIKNLDIDYSKHFDEYFLFGIGGTISLLWVATSVIKDIPSLFSEFQGQDRTLRRSVKNKKLNSVDLRNVLEGLSVEKLIVGDKEVDLEVAFFELNGIDFTAKSNPISWPLTIDEALFNSKAAKLDDEKVKMLLSIHPIYKINLDRQVRSRNAAERRGVRNLLLGILFSFFGIGILTYRALSLTTTDYESFAMTFLPGATLGLLIELIAFFFLRLYSKSLEESKYYANEITILEARFLGYFMATVHGDDDERKAIIADFGKYLRELPTLRSTPVLDKATTGALIDLVKSVATATKGGNGGV